MTGGARGVPIGAWKPFGAWMLVTGVKPSAAITVDGQLVPT